DLALSDGAQSLTFDNFRQFMSQLIPVVQASGRKLATSSIKIKP
ncbi:unnamed protein product, partial [marine sediment metagenome]